MSLEALSSYTFHTKYARYNKDIKRRETFDEAVDRVMAMHRTKYAGMGLDAEMDMVTKAIKEKLVLGSQRALQFGGDPIIKKNARIYNCVASYCDRPRFFQEAMWLLLCGCGVGFSVQKHHVAKLPTIIKRTDDTKHYIIQDSIEGWADAIGVLIASYMQEAEGEFAEYSAHPIKFIYTKIRPAGSAVAGGSGKAPGPEPLRRSMKLIEELLELHLATHGENTQLRPIECYDIVMHSSDAVLAGGVRRSATICLFSKDDEEMTKAKTGNWLQENPQRARSNNSALLVRNETSKKEFLKFMDSVKQFGEPGFVWSNSTEIVYNPCVEIGLYPVDVDSGKTGWEFCNLTEINMKLCTTKEKFLEACTASAILGTLQAGYNSFPYLGEVTERICRNESLLGCSMTGMSDSPDIAFNPETQREGAEHIKFINSDIARRIGINPAARATCVKPAGSTSCVLGTASGIHPHHAHRYFRRVQTNKHEAPASYFQLHNPRAVEKSFWSPNGTDLVITFCVTPPDQALTKQTISAIELLRRVQLTQQNWVAAGKTKSRCAHPAADHNVSNTINVRAEEWDELSEFIYDNRKYFAGISLIPEGGDLDYKQAPMCAVWTSEEIHKEYGIGALFASGLIVDGLRAFDEDLWFGCDIVLGTSHIVKPNVPEYHNPKAFGAFTKESKKYIEQADWVRRANKFAVNYFKGDVKAMTYCLKRVHNCKLWEDLTREMQPIDYSLLEESEDNTKGIQEVACAGGNCEMK